MKRKKLKVVILFLVVIEGIFLYLNYKSYNNKENNQVFNEVQVADNLKGSKQIAIKQQKEDFTWEDKGTNMNAWPDINTFEYYGSECTDASGKAITPTTSVIQFNEQTQIATITTDKTIYCTLKFARRSTVLKLMQKTTTSNYLKTVADNDELLRYVGTKTDVSDNKLNNFICFGTENKDTCLANKGTYMYRIIGITTDKVNASLGLQKNQIKIIKATPIKENNSVKTIAWSGDSDKDWDNNSNTVRTYLNGTFLGTITGTVGTHKWSELISEPKWYKGDNASASSSSEEVAKLTIGNYKVGLMYASDYVNSGAQSTTNWLFIANGMNGSTSVNEWTMTRDVYKYPFYRAWIVFTEGYLVSNNVYDTIAVRPVLYLTTEISISGQGTESDPFIISDRIV